jgi:Ni/Co efflux regulator RcnB
MNKKTNLLRIGLLVLLISFLAVNSIEAQSRQRLRELENKEQDRQAEQQAAEEEGRQRHKDIQSKQTRKEMKRYEKQSKRYNNNRKEPFWKKWFQRNKR